MPSVCGAFGRLTCYSQGLHPTETLCGPLVLTVLQAHVCGHVCHIPPLSFQQTGRLYHAIVLSHLDDASSPPNLTVTRLSDSCHQYQPSYPPGSKGLCTGDWQAFHFLSPAAVVRHHQFHRPAHVSICCDMQTIPFHMVISLCV